MSAYFVEGHTSTVFLFYMLKNVVGSSTAIKRVHIEHCTVLFAGGIMP